MNLIPKKDYQWNPLVKLGTNARCGCGSGKKFKRCCRDIVPRFVPKEYVSAWEALYFEALIGVKRAW